MAQYVGIQWTQKREMKVSKKVMKLFCPFCRADMSLMEKEDKEEHLVVHKTLAHKVLPMVFKEESLAHSTLPFILFTHFGSTKKTQ